MKRVELAFRNANLEDMLENISMPEFTQKRGWEHREGVRTDGSWGSISWRFWRGERTDGAYLK